MQYIFLFPGQGSQKIGMASDLYREFAHARLRFDEARKILGQDIAQICFNGPEELLKETQNTQPALFTVEAIITDILAQKGIRPAYAAGHSLGEYSALYAAGVFSFSDGLALVAERGRLMAEAGKTMPGTMAAIIGLPLDKVKSVLESVRSGVVVAANENGLTQTVISGEIEPVKQACAQMLSAGAKKVVELNVSAAFHSPLMQKVADRFAQALERCCFLRPICPVFSNVTAEAETDPSIIKQLLAKQLVSPVRWVSIMAALQNLSMSCLEIGPGTVLKGLVKNFNKDINVFSCESVENIYSIIQQSLDK